MKGMVKLEESLASKLVARRQRVTEFEVPGTGRKPAEEGQDGG